MDICTVLCCTGKAPRGGIKTPLLTAVPHEPSSHKGNRYGEIIPKKKPKIEFGVGPEGEEEVDDSDSDSDSETGSAAEAGGTPKKRAYLLVHGEWGTPGHYWDPDEDDDFEDTEAALKARWAS